MNKTIDRLAGSILSDPRPIHEAVKDPRYEIGNLARKASEQNYQQLLSSEELRRRFFDLVDSPAPQWEIQWRFGLDEEHYWSLVLNLEL